MAARHEFHSSVAFAPDGQEACRAVQNYGGTMASLESRQESGRYIIFDNGNGMMHVSFRDARGERGDAIDLTEHGIDPNGGIAPISPDGRYVFFRIGGDCARRTWLPSFPGLRELRRGLAVARPGTEPRGGGKTRPTAA